MTQCALNDNCISDLALNKDWDLACCFDTETGYTDLVLAANHRVVAQQVRSRLLHVLGTGHYEDVLSIDWHAHLQNPELNALLDVEIRALLSDTDGVVDVDLGEALLTTDDALSISGICFTSECCYKTNTETVSI